MSDDSGHVNQARYVTPGGSYATFEPPDLCIGVFVGRVPPEEMELMFAELQRLAHGKQHVFAMVDLSRSEWFSPETRKAAAEGGKGMGRSVRGTAMIGASFQMRMFATLITKALNLINAAPDKENPLRFLATEAEARAWFAQLRKKIQEGEGEHGRG